MSQTILNIVSKNPEIPHITDHMKPATMEEHGSKERKENGRYWSPRTFPNEKNVGGNQSVAVKKRGQVITQRKLINKNQHIGDNQKHRDQRKPSRRIFVP